MQKVFTPTVIVTGGLNFTSYIVLNLTETPLTQTAKITLFLLYKPQKNLKRNKPSCLFTGK